MNSSSSCVSPSFASGEKQGQVFPFPLSLGRERDPDPLFLHSCSSCVCPSQSSLSWENPNPTSASSRLLPGHRGSFPLCRAPLAPPSPGLAVIAKPS